ncbi:MAG: ABC transporter permease, partial [Planctomycetes bacterium]|nr:ABC transporter permease [Planctomycetota bacterium]
DGSSLRRFLHHEQVALFLCFIGRCIVASFLSPYFFTLKNIMNVLRSASLIAITGMGMVLIILLGDIDLSVGSTQGLVGVLCALVITVTGNLYLTIVFVVLGGAVIGLVNSLLVTKARITPLIATLGTMAVLRGAAYVTTNGASVSVKNAGFTWLGTGYVGPIPVPLLIAAVFGLVLWFILAKTAYGRYLYATGGCAEAAKLSGIDVNRIKRIAYIISGILTAVTAMLLAARMSTGQPNAGIGFEFQV